MNIKTYNKSEKFQTFKNVRISIASPQTIRTWSKGQVKNPETINYRTFKPESGGLFCQRIFGPVRDYECGCGKYKRIKYKGVICDRCGVEVTLSRVRRERMGHIELAVPVAHIWFLKSMPSKLGIILDMTSKSLERVIYYENYMITDSGKTNLSTGTLLNDKEYEEAQEKYGDNSFIAKSGAEALKDILSKFNLSLILENLNNEIIHTRSKQIKKKLSRRIKVIKGLIDAKIRPEWLILEALPVISPDLRPLVPLDGGRFATSDLNDLYRRVINRNNRLKNLLNLKTPEVIINNEKRMLQEAVDALFDNGRQGRSVTTSGNRPLKSLSDMLKGKQGRFRQNLLGKRVDYSGRSVIVIGPELQLHQCGIPKKMALILFEPFIIKRLKELDFVHTVRGARKMIEKRSPEVWDILAEVTKGHPLLLNRAPTLHRLSIQAFEPVLIEGDAIRIHPLVCTAYNADFDGDQMAVHVPLSSEAIMETKSLMLSTNNIFMPSSGNPVFTPSQDIVMGVYYLTLEFNHNNNKRIPVFKDHIEVMMAEQLGYIKNHDWIHFENPNYQQETYFGNSTSKIILTTVGRVIFNTIMPLNIGFINYTVTKDKLSKIILKTYKIVGAEQTVKHLDKMKNLGFDAATKAGISIGMTDLTIPHNKSSLIDEARSKIKEIEDQYISGIITQEERKNKIFDIWTRTTDLISQEVFSNLKSNNVNEHINSLFLMMDSGARGNKQQVRQLCGMRGLMARPSGEIIERPVISSFKEGLSVLEYFSSTHGARKGLADTALKTADAGYLTRKLCDVAMDVIIDKDDDGNRDGIWKEAIYEGDDKIVSLSERIIGRCSSEDIYHPLTKNIIVKNGEIITEQHASLIEQSDIEKVKIMSPLTSINKDSISAKSYGIDPATGSQIKIGSAVGIIAAQSIGEPGTQLTMRTFHVGGIASQFFKIPEIRTRKSGIVQYKELKIVKTVNDENIVVNKTGEIVIIDKNGNEIECYNIGSGSLVKVKNNHYVNSGDVLATWDPHSIPILSEIGGMIKFHDMMPGITLKKDIDEITGRTYTTIIDHKEDLNPRIEIINIENQATNTTNKSQKINYPIPIGAQVIINEGDIIYPGTILAKTPRSTSRTQDITGGLPRVSELLEARKPKDPAILAKIDGIVTINKGLTRGKKRLLINNELNNQEEEHLIPHGKHIIINDGDIVKKGQHLTEGSADISEILEIIGEDAVQEYLIKEIQKVYRMQGVIINDKHIEIIIAKMLRKVKITDPGDSEFLWGEQVDKISLLKINEEINSKGGQPAEYIPVLLGITKAALETDSFISAASFMETTRVLTDAAMLGKIDHLKGFKENVIMGNLIPAGTGFKRHRTQDINNNIKIKN